LTTTQRMKEFRTHSESVVKERKARRFAPLEQENRLVHRDGRRRPSPAGPPKRWWR